MNQANATLSRPHVVIVGGGFGGLHAARGLYKANVDITLVDRRNFHLFQPLLYQVASAVLSPADIAAPIRSIFRDQPNVTCMMGEVSDVDLEQRQVILQHGALHYDYLILAAGATHSYFGHDEEWSSLAPGLKTVEDSLEIRRRILAAFEAAELEDDQDSRRAKLTFIVVGAGPTGVELAGAIQEIAADTISRDFRRIDTTTTRVIIVEGSQRVLSALPQACSERARNDLEKMGVEVMLNALVTDIDDDGVDLKDGSRIEATNVFWAAGVKPSPLAQTLGIELMRSGHVPVEHDLSIQGHPEVFAIGDMVHYVDPKTQTRVPGVAPAAMQMGDFVAKVIHGDMKQRENSSRPTFNYLDKGSMATIGRNKAVASVFGREFGGFTAWLLWGVIHIMFLVGFRNRFAVMLSWVWHYLSYSKGARLITGNPRTRIKKPGMVTPFEPQPQPQPQDSAVS